MLEFLGIVKPLKLVFLDVETTSLDPESGEIIEIALLWGENNSYCRKVKPLNLDTADPKALEINGYSADEWYDAIHPALLVEEIKPILSGAVVVAHNAYFDVSFIDELFYQYGIKWQKKRPIDTITLAYEHLSPIGLKSVSMDSIRRFLCWSTKGGHRALKDTRDVRKLYYTLNKASPIHRLYWWIRNKLNRK